MTGLTSILATLIMAALAFIAVGEMLVTRPKRCQPINVQWW